MRTMDIKKEGPIFRTARLTNPLNSVAKLQIGGGSGNIIFRFLPPKSGFFTVQFAVIKDCITYVYLFVYQFTKQLIESHFWY
jgi:hypothetical protein